MINVTITNNTSRNTYIASKTESVRSVLENASVDFNGKEILVDGATLTGGSLNSTFADLGYSDEEGKNKAYISCITRKNNA